MTTVAKNSLRIEFVLLTVGVALFIFSNGRWCVSIATWLAPVFLLRFTKSNNPITRLTILFILIAISSRIMLNGIIPSLLGVLTYILTIYYAILWFLPYLVDRLIASKFNGFYSTLIFPITVVSLEYFNNVFFGTWASTAYTQFDNLALIQLASVTGMWGISFVVMWFGPVINWVIDNKWEWSVVRKGVLIFSVTLILILLYGGLRLEVWPPTSKTVAIASFTPSKEIKNYYDEIQRMGFSSSVQMARENRMSQSVLLDSIHNQIFENSKDLIVPDIELALWPEGAISVLEEDEVAFIDKGKKWAKEQDVYLLLGYLVIPKADPGRLAENKSVFINPGGEFEWEYLKTHPTPGSTNKVGDGILPVSNTPFGKVSTTICYDMDFTALLNKAGRLDIDIMLVPAWDWKAIDPLHARMAVFRAIENGFSMIRQTGEGLSIAVDHQGRTLASMDHFTSKEHTMMSKIPTKGVRTIYAVIGDSFAWLCILVLGLAFGWTLFGRNTSFFTAV